MYYFETKDAFVLLLDWSKDSRYLRFNTSIHEVYIWDTTTGEEQAYSCIKDTEWNTHNCIYSWEMQAAFPDNTGPDFINCRTMMKIHDREEDKDNDEDQTIIATCDDNSMINLASL